jgi:hypothetical protein
VRQDGAGLEDADRGGAAAVKQGGNFRIRIDGDESAAELVAVTDADQPGIVLRTLVAEGEQLFERDGDLLAVGGAERIECIGCLPTGSSLSWVAPAIGRVMLAKRPPFSLFQVQTAGGAYSGGIAM